MDAYRNILVAVDFSPAADGVARRAFDIATRNNARLSFIHVVEYLPFVMDNELMMPPALDVEAQLMSNARAQLAKMMARLSGPAAAEQLVELGSTKVEILRIATERAVDLIVVGSHGRHGWARMLGSTADAVLHGAGCDVLAVRVQQ